VYPSRVKGKDAECRVTVNTASLVEGGSFSDTLKYHSTVEKLEIPVQVFVEPARLAFWLPPLAFVLTLLSFLPVAGLFTLVWLLAMYYSIPKGERAPLKVFVYVSTLINGFYLAGSALGLLFWYLRSSGRI
jgi:hypothetical protein